MAENHQEITDPRVLRTRRSLQQALARVMETVEFEKISVQEIAEAAGVNRATFYDHYPDKFALLECMVGTRFWELLERRGIRFDGGCASALKGIVLGVCDYLAETPGAACERRRQMEPHLEAAVMAVLRRSILEGLRKHPVEGSVAMEVLAAMMSGAIYGAAKEWVRTPGRCSSEDIAEAVMVLVGAMMDAERSAVPAATVVFSSR